MLSPARFSRQLHAMDPAGNNPLRGIDAVMDAGEVKKDPESGGTDSGRAGAGRCRSGPADGRGGATRGTPTAEFEARDRGVADSALDRDVSLVLSLLAAVNPRTTCFSFARPTTSLQDTVVGFRGLVLGGETAVSPMQRALAAAVGDHMGRVQRAANFSLLPYSLQAETNASAHISRGQLSSSLDGEHAHSSLIVQAARLSFSNITGVNVAPGLSNTVAQDGGSGNLFERQGAVHPPLPSLATPLAPSVF